VFSSTEYYAKRLPSFKALPIEQQQDLLERARYQTFTKPGKNAQWAIVFVSIFFGTVVLLGSVSYVNSHFLELSNSTLGWVRICIYSLAIGLGIRLYFNSLSNAVEDLLTRKSD